MKWKNIILGHLLEIQDNLCRICGQPFSAISPPEIDHRVPKSNGGKDIIINLQAVHHICNIKKGTKPQEKNSLFPIDLKTILETKEIYYLEKALSIANNQKEAASLLSLSYREFRHRIKKYKIAMK